MGGYVDGTTCPKCGGYLVTSEFFWWSVGVIAFGSILGWLIVELG